jgi:hypothetical protein
MQPGTQPRARRFQDIPWGPLQSILDQMSTRRLMIYHRSQEHLVDPYIKSEIRKALDWRWLQIGNRMHEAARDVFDSELLTAVSRIIFRFYYEWENPLRVPVFQSMRELNLGGRLPFPDCRFNITPLGAICPVPLHPEVLYEDMQEGHAYVTGFPRCKPLRDCTSLAIHLCMLEDPQKVMCIDITRDTPDTPGRVTFSLSAIYSHIPLYPAFCGVICYLFFSVGTKLHPLPRMLRNSMLNISLGCDSILGEGIGFPWGVPIGLMPRETREGLVFIMSVMPLMVPGSKLLEGMNRQRVFTMDMLLYDDVG